MTGHEEIQGLLGAFALDAVDGEEQEVVEVHLRHCPQCRAEVAEHREVASMLGHGGATAPAGIWDRIVAALEPVAPSMRIEVDQTGRGFVVPIAPPPSSPDHRSRPSRVLIAALAAVAVIVIAMALVIVRLNQRIDTLAGRSPSDEVACPRAGPGDRTAVLRSADPTTKIVVGVTVRADGAGCLRAGELPGLPPGVVYQLWNVQGTKAISLGTFDGGDSYMRFSVASSVKLLGVTRERSPGVVVTKNQPFVAGRI